VKVELNPFSSQMIMTFKDVKIWGLKKHTSASTLKNLGWSRRRGSKRRRLNVERNANVRNGDLKRFTMMKI
jgi:hypothetical protein